MSNGIVIDLSPHVREILVKTKMTDLLSKAQPAQQKRCAKNKQQVRKDRPEKGSLDDADFVLARSSASLHWLKTGEQKTNLDKRKAMKIRGRKSEHVN